MADPEINLGELAHRSRVLARLLADAEVRGLPCPGSATVQYQISLTADTPDEVEVWSGFLRGHVVQRPHEDTIQHVAHGAFADVPVSVCAIVPAEQAVSA